MRKYYAFILLFVLAIAACKKNNLAPKTAEQARAANQALVYGKWTWSAQYTSAQTLIIQNPANTGINETLQFNTDGTWTQTKNNSVTNSGPFAFVELIAPGPFNGPNTIPFISIVNSRVNDTTRYDNLNFDTGFSSSYYLTKDSLVFYGVNQIAGNDTSYIASRVYVK